MDELRVAGHHDIEAIYREHGKRLWWVVLAYAGDREIASDAVAEASTRNTSVVGHTDQASAVLGVSPWAAE